MINFYYGTQKLIDRCKKINITGWLVKKMVSYFKLKGMPDIVKRSEFLGIKLSTIELRVTLNKTLQSDKINLSDEIPHTRAERNNFLQKRRFYNEFFIVKVFSKVISYTLC